MKYHIYDYHRLSCMEKVLQGRRISFCL